MKKTFLILITLFFTGLISLGLGCEPVQIEYQDGIYHITLEGKKVEKGLKFVSSEKLMTNKEAHESSGSKLTINTGFFDPKNQKTISYIVTDGQIAADPLLNENLLSNPLLRQNIDKIVNRTEFRVIDCDGKITYEIVPHKTGEDFACNILTSAQGGPMILPELRLEEEFFVLKKDGKVVRESASVLEKTARTIIAIKGQPPCQQIHILVITNDNPKNIYEVRELCQKMGFDRAMAFDGGSSTSLNYKKTIDVVSTPDSGGRMLKSFMILNY